MTDPFTTEIRAFGFNFPPRNWAFCNGQLLPLSQNTAVFSLIGTYYGGNGQSTFALPNLIDSAPMAFGDGNSTGISNRPSPGEQGGSQYVSLLQSEMPVHTHSMAVSTQAASARQPAGSMFGTGTGVSFYNDNAQPTTTMAPEFLAPAGGSLPHNNMQPSLALNFCICLAGIFPPRG